MHPVVPAHTAAAGRDGLEPRHREACGGTVVCRERLIQLRIDEPVIAVQLQQGFELTIGPLGTRWTTRWLTRVAIPVAVRVLP